MSGKDNVVRDLFNRKQGNNRVVDTAKKSNLDILNELEQIIANQTENDIDPDLIEYYLAVLQERAPVVEDYDSKAELDKLRKDHPLIFEKEIHNEESETAIISTDCTSVKKTRWLPKVVAMFAIVVTLTAAGTLTAHTFGYDLWGAAAEWTRETFGFIYQSDSQVQKDVSGQNNGVFTDMQSALDEYGITAKLLPAYIPEGYEQENFIVDDWGDGVVHFYVSYRTKGRESLLIISVKQGLLGADHQKDAEDPEIYVSGGVQHYLMTNMGEYKVVWSHDNYESNISGLSDKDELIRIIDSIYEG